METLNEQELSELFRKRDAAKELPRMLPGRYFSDRVFARVKGSTETQVMCLVFLNGEYFWANCYGNIHGTPELDDNYEVEEWWLINK
jgi:hypothetical protein